MTVATQLRPFTDARGAVPIGDDGYPIFIDPVEAAPRDVLDRHQEAGIQSIIARGFDRAPLIRKVWQAAGLTARDIRSTADFVAKAPFINKDDIRAFRDAYADPIGGMGHYGPGEIVQMSTTSGTTGDPTPIPGGVRMPSEQTYVRDEWYMGLRPGGYHAHIMFTFRGGHRRRGVQDFGACEINFSMDPREMPRLCEASRRFRPTTMSIMANPLLSVLEAHFERTGEDPIDTFKSYKGVICGGEPLSARLATMARGWGMETFETTSLGDVAGATECRAHDGMHAYEDMAFIECIDPLGIDPIPDGEVGELVVTTLVDRFTPLIRYRTGDLVTIDRSPCSCGRTHARFKILGRATDQILVRGRSILPREIMGYVELHDETRGGLFQIVRSAREMDVLKLRVGYDPSRLTGQEASLGGRLSDDLVARIGCAVDIELVHEAELLKLGPPHKIPRVTSR